MRRACTGPVVRAAASARPVDDARRLSERTMRRIVAEHPPLRQYPAVTRLLSRELRGGTMQALVEHTAGRLSASSDEGLRSPAVAANASAARAQLSVELAEILRDGGLGKLLDALERQVDAVLVDHTWDASGWELSRRLEDAGHHAAAGLALYYQREASAAFLSARHRDDDDLVAEDYALVGAIGAITGAINREHKGKNYVVKICSFESQVPQPFNLGVGKYDVFARMNAAGPISLEQIGEVKITSTFRKTFRPKTSGLQVDLLPFLTDVPPGECTLLFAERKHFAGYHRESVHNTLVDLLTGALGRSSVCARMLSGHGACFMATTGAAPGADPVAAIRRDRHASRPACVEIGIRRYGYDFTGGVAAIEGPPGTGKTYTLARIIQAMRCRGLKVAVTGPSHRVLQSMESELEDLGVETYRICPKMKTTLRHGLKESESSVVLGTTYQLCKPEARSQFHMLCVDEAGQMPFVDVLASAPTATDGLLLAGDAKQLPHIALCKHRGYAGTSALAQAEASIPAKSLMMLTETRRMCPPITAFISESFYDGKIQCSEAVKLGQQGVTGSKRFSGQGVRTVCCEDTAMTATGNKQSRAQRDVVIDIVRELTAEGVAHTSSAGGATPEQVRPQDILVVAPYNAQVRSIHAGLKAKGYAKVEVGTVNRLQGREAAIVIFSMTNTQDFAVEEWRVNVAVSRAKTLAIVVACEEGLEILNAKFQLNKHAMPVTHKEQDLC